MKRRTRRTRKHIGAKVNRILQLVYEFMIVLQVILMFKVISYMSKVWRVTIMVDAKVEGAIAFEVLFTIMTVYQFLTYAIRIARAKNSIRKERKLKEGWYSNLTKAYEENAILNEEIADLKNDKSLDKVGEIIANLGSELEIYKRDVANLYTQTTK
jgi:hypothetical protein